MDYEKAYKEALERAKNLYSAVHKGCKEVIENVFPELAESEDEKTRRMLDTITYKMSQHQPDIFTGEENEWFNAYLEKQKEQKPNIEICPHSIKSKSYLETGYPIEQKEQKPAEKEITLTDFEKVLNTFLFDFANSTVEDCEPKDYIKKHSAEILKSAYKELNTQLQQDLFEAKQEGRREGYEVAKE